MNYLTSTISLAKIKHSQFEPDGITFSIASDSNEPSPHEKAFYAATIEMLALIYDDWLSNQPHPD